MSFMDGRLELFSIDFFKLGLYLVEFGHPVLGRPLGGGPLQVAPFEIANITNVRQICPHAEK